MNTVTHRSESAESPATGTAGLSFTGRIAGWSAAHRWMVLGASVLMLVLAIVASSMFTPKLLDDSTAKAKRPWGPTSSPSGSTSPRRPPKVWSSATRRWTPTARYSAPRLKDLYSS